MNDNRFLAACPPAVREACAAAGTIDTYAAGTLLGLRGDRISSVHLPFTGVISEIEDGLDGGSAEVTIVGNEGCSGIETILDVTMHPYRRVIDVPTTALVVPAATFAALRDEHPDFHRFVHRYVAARMRGLGISIGCYARHPVPARLARWLLRMHDRIDRLDFSVSHRTIALMLGVRRATVTRAIHELCAAACITSNRNSIRIIDRKRLETITCSCYPEARDLFNEMYGSSAGVGEIS